MNDYKSLNFVNQLCFVKLEGSTYTFTHFNLKDFPTIAMLLETSTELEDKVHRLMFKDLIKVEEMWITDEVNLEDYSEEEHESYIHTSGQQSAEEIAFNIFLGEHSIYYDERKV